MRNIRFVIGALCMLIGLSNLQVFGHPGGNLLVVGDQVLWSYVDPIDSTDHMACVMIKRRSDRPEILLRSEHAASDFFLSSTAKNVFIIERYYIQQDDSYKMRVFEMPPGENPKVIWDWQSDTHRIGEAGFFMPDTERIVFVKYPSVWEVSRNELPVRLSISDFKFVRIRALKDGNKLLILINP